MDKKDQSSYVAAILGIILGVMLVVTINSITEGRRKKVDYASWQKLNVILEEVRKNYVDTIDVKGVTDAAVVAALSKLDPHTIYLPPDDLEKSETELA